MWQCGSVAYVSTVGSMLFQVFKAVMENNFKP